MSRFIPAGKSGLRTRSALTCRRSAAAVGAASFVLLAAACSTSTLPHDASPLAGQREQQPGGLSSAAGTLGAPTGQPAGQPSSSIEQQRPGTGGQSPGAQTGGTVPAPVTDGTASTSAAHGSTVGVTQKSINISVSAPFSGVYGPLVKQNFEGIQLWQQEVNASGGIHGRRIILTEVDNQNTADGAIAACKEARSNNTFMVFILLTATTAEDSCEDAGGLPVFDVAPSALEPWSNVLVAHYVPTLAATEVSFLKSSYMNSGGKKIGIVYNGDLPINVAEYKAVAAELGKQGLKLVHVEKVTTAQSSFVSEMSRMKAAGAQTVLQFVILEGPGIIRDAKAIGYTPQWYCGSGVGTCADLVAQTGHEALAGIRGLRSYTTTETSAYASFVAKQRKYNGDSAATSTNTQQMLFYAQADILGQMLKLTGPKLNRSSFLTAARTIKHYDNHYVAPFTLKARQVGGKQVWVGDFGLYAVECCNSNRTYRTLSPPRQQF